MVAVSVALEGEIIAMVSPEFRNWAESDSIQQSISDMITSFFILLAKIQINGNITII